MIKYVDQKTFDINNLSEEQKAITAQLTSLKPSERTQFNYQDLVNFLAPYQDQIAHLTRKQKQEIGETLGIDPKSCVFWLMAGGLIEEGLAKSDSFNTNIRKRQELSNLAYFCKKLYLPNELLESYEIFMKSDRYMDEKTMVDTINQAYLHGDPAAIDLLQELADLGVSKLHEKLMIDSIKAGIKIGDLLSNECNYDRSIEIYEKICSITSNNESILVLQAETGMKLAESYGYKLHLIQSDQRMNRKDKKDYSGKRSADQKRDDAHNWPLAQKRIEAYERICSITSNNESILVLQAETLMELIVLYLAPGMGKKRMIKKAISAYAMLLDIRSHNKNNEEIEEYQESAWHMMEVSEENHGRGVMEARESHERSLDK